jgi:hypothetical protein
LDSGRKFSLFQVNFTAGSVSDFRNLLGVSLVIFAAESFSWTENGGNAIKKNNYLYLTNPVER